MQFRSVLGVVCGPLLGLLGTAGGLGGPLGADGSKSHFEFPLLGPSWGSFGALLDRLGHLLGRLEVLLGRLKTLLRASWTVLDAVKAKNEYVKHVRFPMGLGRFLQLGALLWCSWGSLDAA